MGEGICWSMYLMLTRAVEPISDTKDCDCELNCGSIATIQVTSVYVLLLPPRWYLSLSPRWLLSIATIDIFSSLRSVSLHLSVRYVLGGVDCVSDSFDGEAQSLNMMVLSSNVLCETEWPKYTDSEYALTQALDPYLHAVVAIAQ